MLITDRKTIQLEARGGNLLVTGNHGEKVPDGARIAVFTVKDIGCKHLKMGEPVSDVDRNAFDRFADRLDVIFYSKESIDSFIEILTQLSEGWSNETTD